MASPVLKGPPPSTQRARHFRRREKVLGQFFTPPGLAAWIVDLAAAEAPGRGMALDPACGDGAFLEPLCAHGFAAVWGIDRDPEVLARARDRCGGCRALHLEAGDALERLPLLEGRFDVVATNPPFSAKFGRVSDPWLLARFALGQGRRSEAPEALFLELGVRALRPGGILAIILPEGLFRNLPYRRVRAWLLQHVTPLAVLRLSGRFFDARAALLFARKGPAPSEARVVVGTLVEEAALPPPASRPWEALEDRRSLVEWVEGLSWAPALGPLPTPFPTSPLGDLLREMRTGQTEYGPRRRFAPEGIPFLSARAVTPFGVDPRRDGRFVSPGSPMDKPGARVRIGDLLFVRVGVGCIGRAAVVLAEDEVGLADDYLYILRPSPGVLPEFLALFMQTDLFGRQARRRCPHGTLSLSKSNGKSWNGGSGSVIAWQGHLDFRGERG